MRIGSITISLSSGRSGEPSLVLNQLGLDRQKAHAVCSPSSETDQTAVHSTVTPKAATNLVVETSPGNESGSPKFRIIIVDPSRAKD